MDVSAFYRGYHGDLNETYVVGEVDDESKHLIRVTFEVHLRPCSRTCACLCHSLDGRAQGHCSRLSVKHMVSSFKHMVSSLSSF